MIDEKLLGRITANPDIFGGKPIVRGMRISVELILGLLAQGETPETILADYPDLEPTIFALVLHTHTQSSQTTNLIQFRLWADEVSDRPLRWASHCTVAAFAGTRCG